MEQLSVNNNMASLVQHYALQGGILNHFAVSASAHLVENKFSKNFTTFTYIDLFHVNCVETTDS